MNAAMKRIIPKFPGKDKTHTKLQCGPLSYINILGSLSAAFNTSFAWHVEYHVKPGP